MSWRMAPLQARSTTTIRPGMDVRVSDPQMRQMRTGQFPSLMVHPNQDQDVPEFGIVPDPLSSSEDLKHLAEAARTWASRLDEAAWVRETQEDSEPYEDAG